MEEGEERERGRRKVRVCSPLVSSLNTTSHPLAHISSPITTMLALLCYREHSRTVNRCDYQQSLPSQDTVGTVIVWLTLKL